MIVHDSHGLPFRRYGEDVFHCVRCHKRAMLINSKEDGCYVAVPDWPSRRGEPVPEHCCRNPATVLVTFQTGYQAWACSAHRDYHVPWAEREAGRV